MYLVPADCRNEEWNCIRLHNFSFDAVTARKRLQQLNSLPVYSLWANNRKISDVQLKSTIDLPTSSSG